MHIEKKKLFTRIVIPLFVIVPVSLILGLLLAEKLVRFAYPQLTQKQAQLVSLKAYNKSDILPFDLKPNNETVHIGNTHEFTYTIKTNSLGYRMDEFPIEKPEGEYRILLLGDSTTFGFGVEMNESFPEQLEKMLAQNPGIKNKKIQVINAGFADGKSPDSYYLYLKEKGLKLNPDLVIVNLFVNNDVLDMDDMVWEKIDENGLPLKISLRTSYIDGVYYRLKRPYQNWKLIPPVLRESHLWVLFATALETKSPGTVIKIKQALKQEDLPTIPQDEVNLCLFQEKCSERVNQLNDKFYKVTDATIKLAKDANIPIIYGMIPANPQVKDTAGLIGEINFALATKSQIKSKYLQVLPQKKWRDYLEQKSVFVIDPLPYMVNGGSIEESFKDYYFPQDGHATVKGNRRLAQAYYDALMDDWDLPKKVSPNY